MVDKNQKDTEQIPASRIKLVSTLTAKIQSTPDQAASIRNIRRRVQWTGPSPGDIAVVDIVGKDILSRLSRAL